MKFYSNIVIYLTVFVSIILFSCNNSVKTKDEAQKILIISKMSSVKNYSNWIHHFDSSLTLINAYHTNSDSLSLFLEKCSGILITGGADIHPDRYGKASEIDRCGKPDLFRDSLETALILYALKHNIPLLGICRGEQLMNVANGGTLIIDIPEDVGSDSLHRKNGKQIEHHVHIKKDSYLYNICQVDTGIVMSHHHQAAEKVAEIFKASAFAEDNVIEALEPVNIDNYNFILGVQWHPERMDYENPLSKNIGQEFIKAINED